MSWADQMVKARVGAHDGIVANILGIAAAWSYSDIDTFSRMMYCRAFIGPHEIVGVNVGNPVLFVNSTAYLLQTMDKRLAILCFRGTEYQDSTSWLADASTRVDPFLSSGHVHGGFYRATLAIWRPLEMLLNCARVGYSICEAAVRERAKFKDCIAEAVQSGGEDGAHIGEGGAPAYLSRLSPPPTTADPDKLEALYITGHSLGGAMAVIAAALLYADPALACFQQKLRGVYTFGQPMVGHGDFTHQASKDFGHKLFRHVYGVDLVPRLPPRSTGDFAHFGTEYTSGEGGWMYQTSTVRPVRTILGSSLIGVIAWIQQQLPEVPLLRRLRLPWSWGDHAPLHYLRTSQATTPGTEFGG